MKVKISLNINEIVSVVLTEKGKEVYQKYFASYLNGGPELKDGNILEEQLWCIMQIFGGHIYNGGPNLFVNNDIFIFVEHSASVE